MSNFCFRYTHVTCVITSRRITANSRNTCKVCTALLCSRRETNQQPTMTASNRYTTVYFLLIIEVDYYTTNVHKLCVMWFQQHMISLIDSSDVLLYFYFFRFSTELLIIIASILTYHVQLDYQLFIVTWLVLFAFLCFYTVTLVKVFWTYVYWLVRAYLISNIQGFWMK